MRIRPSPQGQSPAAARNRVDLPQPLPPWISTRSPARITALARLDQHAAIRGAQRDAVQHQARRRLPHGDPPSRPSFAAASRLSSSATEALHMAAPVGDLRPVLLQPGQRASPPRRRPGRAAPGRRGRWRRRRRRGRPAAAAGWRRPCRSRSRATSGAVPAAASGRMTPTTCAKLPSRWRTSSSPPPIIATASAFSRSRIRAKRCSASTRLRSIWMPISGRPIAQVSSVPAPA